jgi:hypothetical protein
LENAASLSDYVRYEIWLSTKILVLSTIYTGFSTNSLDLSTKQHFTGRTRRYGETVLFYPEVTEAFLLIRISLVPKSSFFLIKNKNMYEPWIGGRGDEHSVISVVRLRGEIRLPVLSVSL